MINNTTPQFVIVGAAKCGTSSLSYYLGEHPGVFLPKQQIHFHSRKHNLEKDWAHYAEYFCDATPDQVIGEHSPFYYTYEKAALSLNVNCPGVKLIWLLRNPIDRSWSHYWYNIMQGSEHISPRNILSHERWRDIYIRKSEYSTFVETYLRYFDSQSMMFVFTEELRGSPADTLYRICEFLDIDTDFNFSRAGQIKRRTVKPKHITLHQWLGRLRGTGLVSSRGVSSIYRRLNDWSLSYDLPYPAMPHEEKKRLENHFSSFNSKLGMLINRDVEGIWRHDR